MKKLVAKVAYEVAKKEANRGCGFFFYQKKLPGKVVELRKF